MITRNNYEEFFMLYVDNELSAADRQIVESFVDGNPDLKEEWELLLQCRIRPDHHLVFTDRDSLFKQEAVPTIDAENYEEYFLSYIDGELDEKTRKSVEEFTGRHPARQTELTSLRQTVNFPDPAIVFENKEILYKKEKDRRIVLLPWRIAAAALVAGVIGLLIFNPLRNNTPQKAISAFAHQKTQQAPTAVSPADKPDSLKALADNQQPLSEKDLSEPEKTQALSPAPEKKTGPVTPGPVAALHHTAAGQTDRIAGAGRKGERNDAYGDPVNAKGEVAGNTLSSQTDPPVRKREIEQKTVSIVTNDIDGPANKTLVMTTTAGDAPNTRNGASSSFATQALLNPSNDAPEDDFAMESSSPKKNKLRGIFRKVTRVLEKNTSRDDDDKRSVLIGSFQFALK